MTAIFISILAAMCVIAAFSCGFLIGMKLKTAPEMRAAIPDAEKQRRFEEDMKAFEDCMNYSLDVAYGRDK